MIQTRKKILGRKPQGKKVLQIKKKAENDTDSEENFTTKNHEEKP